MYDVQSLPPSITVSPTIVGVSVLTDDGATVQVSLQRPRGLGGLSEDEIVVKAHALARSALKAAAASLAGV